MCQAPAFVTDGTLRIVIAEDDESLAALVESILESDGRFTVVGRAGDGNEAVRLVEEHRPDLVLRPTRCTCCTRTTCAAVPIPNNACQATSAGNRAAYQSSQASPGSVAV